jgi:hypothetical protein
MTQQAETTLVPQALRRWFVIHFVTDMVFAIPMMIAPVRLLTLFGWEAVDPFMTRLAAAALFGIGIESYLGRHAGAESYRTMLTLKVIWSLGAIVAAGVSLAQGLHGRPLMLWAVLVIFLGFNGVWVYWRVRLR